VLFWLLLEIEPVKEMSDALDREEREPKNVRRAVS